MISPDLAMFLIMILCGAALSVFFDLLRALRISFKPGTVVVAVSDVLFCVCVMLSSAACVWNFNNGIFRFYELAGLIFGGLFYFLLASRWILKLFLAIIENILKFIRFILKILLTPSKFLYKILVVPFGKQISSIIQRSRINRDKPI